MATKKAAKKTPAKKPGKKTAKTVNERTVAIETKMVPVDSLQAYYKNPRLGDVTKIAKSLHINQQFKPIVVNIGTLTGRENEILAGNHTWLASREEVSWQSRGVFYEKEPWDEIYATFVDVDDEQAAAINLADNFTAEDGDYDQNLIDELIAGVPESMRGGLGLADEDIDDILARMEEDEEEYPDADDEEDEVVAGSTVDDEEDEEEEGDEGPSFDETPLGDEETAAPEKKKFSTRDREKAKAAGIDLDKVSHERSGALQLADDVLFDKDYAVSVNGNEYVSLLPEMLMTPDDLPDDLSHLKTWAGSATAGDEDKERVWFMNYGIDSTSGMDPDVLKQCIVSFFTWDDYFEDWWQRPSRYTSKVLNSGIKYIVTPDFSPQTEMGNVFLKWQLYRSRYLGRYFQEAGLKVLPHCIWPDGDIKFLTEETLPTLPDKVPMLVFQAQTIDPKKVSGGMDHYKKQCQIMLDEVKPDALILYAGKPGFEVFKELKTKGIEIIPLEHRQAILSKVNNKRKKKTTL